MKSVMKNLQQLLMKEKTCELKENIRMIKTERSYTEKIIWLKKIKEKALIKLLDKVHKYKHCIMISYCLKCRKNTESKT